MKINDNVKLGVGLVATIASGGVIARALMNASGEKNIVNAIGASLAGGVAGGAVGTEVLKIVDVINNKLADNSTEEVAEAVTEAVDDITADE